MGKNASLLQKNKTIWTTQLRKAVRGEGHVMTQDKIMENFNNIAILKCTEEDLRHNIIVLCENTTKLVVGMPTVITKGDYFYFILRDIEAVKSLNVKGEFI
jgi:hypothetical protein